MRISEADLRRRILSDKYNAIVFGAAAPTDVYLVGGYLRDVLIGRKSRDRDYVAAGRFEEILWRVGSQTGARAVQIGGRGLYRFFLKDGISMDLSPLSADIATDLRERDFTVNAMAWSPASGLVDVSGGADDLAKRSIRMISAENIINDPLRILRAYRLAEEMSFSIERHTKGALRLLNGLIKEVKTERITLEFFKVLCRPNPVRMLHTLQQDGIIGNIIACSNGELRDKVKVLSRINEIFKELPLKYRRALHHVFSQNLSFAGLLRLEILLKGHPDNLLCLSSRIQKRLRNLDGGDKLEQERRKLSKGTLFELFETVKEAALDYLITRNQLSLLGDYENYRSVKARRLLTTDEVKDILGLSEGAVLGRMIRYLEKARFERLIRNRGDAMALLGRIHQNGI